MFAVAVETPLMVLPAAACLFLLLSAASSWRDTLQYLANLIGGQIIFFSAYFGVAKLLEWIKERIRRTSSVEPDLLDSAASPVRVDLGSELAPPASTSSETAPLEVTSAPPPPTDTAATAPHDH
jgi:hypothetical protein